jgi:hypothetical protein
MKRKEKRGEGFGWATPATSRKPKRRPDVKIAITTPDRGVRVKYLVIPASGFYPCAGMASLPWVSCLYVFHILWSVCFSVFAVICSGVTLFADDVSLCKACLRRPSYIFFLSTYWFE